jgi:hypothetical protein
VRAILLLAVITGFFLSGCGKGEERNASIPVPPASPTSPPSAPLAKARLPANLVLSPDNPDARSGVRAIPAGLPPGAAVRWEKVSWFINGTEFQGEGALLPPGMIRRGDRVRASAELVMSGERVTLASREVSVRNCLPEVLAADLSETAPKTGQEIRVLVKGRDDDGDPVSFRYRWFLNEREEEGQSMNAHSLEKVPKGTWVHAEVQAFDGIAAGSKRFTSRVRVVNSPPVVEQISIARGEGGRHTANLRVRDADGDPVTILAKTLPEGVALSGTSLSWQESAIPPGMEAPVVLLLSDGDGGDLEYSFRLNAGQK